VHKLFHKLCKAESALILALPLLYTVQLTVFLDTNLITSSFILFKPNILERITLGDLVVIVFLLNCINQHDFFERYINYRTLIFLGFTVFLMCVAFYHLIFSLIGSSIPLFFLRSFYVFILAILFLVTRPVEINSKQYFYILLFFLIFVVIISILKNISLFNYLPNYSEYLDVLVYRFKGLSDNTNNFALGVFSSSALFFLLKGDKDLNKYDWLTIFILLSLAFLMKGRHSLLIIALTALAVLRNTSWTFLSKYLLCVTGIIIILSIRVNIIPLKSNFPFFNTDISSYSLVHDTYLRMIASELKYFGWPPSEIKDGFRTHSDIAMIEEVISKRFLSDQDAANYENYFSNHASTHSAFLQVTISYGLIGLTLFFLIHCLLIYDFYSFFGFNFETQVLILNFFSYLFLNSSRISWFIIFICVSYAMIKKNGTRLSIN